MALPSSPPSSSSGGCGGAGQAGQGRAGSTSWAYCDHLLCGWASRAGRAHREMAGSLPLLTMWDTVP